jgi:hypothetical protein
MISSTPRDNYFSPNTNWYNNKGYNRFTEPPKNFKKMKSENFAILMLSILLAIMFFRACDDNKQIEALQVQLNEANNIKDSLGNIITVKDAKIVQDQEAMKNLRAELFQTTEKYNNKVKEVKALIAQETQVVIKEVKVPYIDSTKMKQWADSIAIKCAEVIKYYEDSTVKIGKQAKDSTAHYKIDATIQKEGINMNEIKFIDSQYVALTEMKGGILKRNTKGKFRLYVPPTTRAEIKHTNPYFQNTGVDAFLFKEKAHRGYGSGILHGAIGSAALIIGLLLIL